MPISRTNRVINQENIVAFMTIRIIRPSVFYTIIFSTVILSFLSCNTKSPDDVAVEVLSLKGPSAMSMLFMMDELKEINKTPLSFEILDEPLQIRARMLKEEPEFALIPTNMAANLYNKGVPYQVAAIPVWGTLIVFGKDQNIVDWQDLKGKRIHLMAKGMTPDILMRFLLMKNGLDPDHDIILDYSFPSHADLANAVIAGLSEIAVLSEPLVSMVLAKNKEVKPIFNLDEEWKKVFRNDFSIPQTSLVVKSSFALENPEFVVSFINEYQEFCSQIDNNLPQAGQLAVHFEILPEASIAINSIPGCNMHVMPSWEAYERVISFLEVFYTFNPESIGGKMPDENFFFQK